MPSTNNSDVRFTEFWRLVIARLAADATLRATLGATVLLPRIYLSTDNFVAPEGVESAPWARLVVVPIDSLWVQDNEDDPRRPKRAGFLIRAEVNDFRAKGYDIAMVLDGIQWQVHTLLYLWAPAVNAMRWAIAIRPLFRWQGPQQTPMFTDERGLWYNSSEWRTELIAPPSGA